MAVWVKCCHCRRVFVSVIYLDDIQDNHHWTACPECVYTVQAQFVDQRCDQPTQCPHKVNHAALAGT